jgi:hypothetical protein
MKLPVPYEDQALWLKALGKVLFDQNYTLVDETLCVSLGGPVATPEYTIRFGAANRLNLFEQARLEFGRMNGLPVAEATPEKLVLKNELTGEVVVDKTIPEHMRGADPEIAYACATLLSAGWTLIAPGFEGVDLDGPTIAEEIRRLGPNPSEFDVARRFFELGKNSK